MMEKHASCPCAHCQPGKLARARHDGKRTLARDDKAVSRVAPRFGFGYFLQPSFAYLRSIFGGPHVLRPSFVRFVRCVVLATFAALASAPARADDAELCAKSLAAPDQGIPACTRLIAETKDGGVAASLFNNRGVAKVSRGDYLDAVADFSAALDRNPGFADAYRNRGLAWQLASEYDKAVSDFTRAIKIAPKAPALFNARGSALLSKEEYSGAIEDFNRAIALSKDYAPAFLNRGIAYQYRRQLDEAVADFTTYVRLVPKDTRGYTNRAAAKMDKADFDGAVADYTAAISQNAQSWAGYTGRGEALRLKGDFDKALADHDKAVEIDANPDTYVNRALLYESRREFDKALADCNEAILANPRHMLAYANRGAIRIEMRDLRGALADLDKAVSLNPNSPLALTFRGNALREAGRLNDSLTDFDRALRSVVDFVAGYTGRGLTYERKGEMASARADYQKALTLPSAVDYGLAKPAQDLATKRIAALDEARAQIAARSARDTADTQVEQRALAERTATAASVERARFEQEARSRAQAERVARANFEAKVKAEASAEIAQRTKAAEERLDAERRMKAASEARERADFEARVKTDAEAKAKADFDTKLKAELDARVTAQVQEREKTMAVAALNAQAPKLAPRSIERRVALVVGNTAYKNVPPLANPAADADAVGDVLKSIGFQIVTVKHDLTREAFVQAIRTFEDDVDRADWALIYYAGHGIEVNGRNYMIPTDARLKSDRDIPDETISLDRILTATERANKIRLIILDACRENPFSTTMRRSQGSRVSSGLARIEPEGGTLVSYAARDGQVAMDGSDNHSPFASAFVKTVTTPGLEVNMMFRSVRDQVLSFTKKAQEPITFGSLSGESFYFVDN